MSWVAVAITGVGLVGAYMQGEANKDAASTQSRAARDANQTQLQMYNQTRADQEPWRQAGVTALTGLQDPDFGKNLEMDPGYQFRLAEGNKAINASAAARGMSNSGATMKALSRYGQDFASSEYNNAYNRQFNRLSSLAGFGTNANSQNAQAGMNTAAQLGQNTMGAANAQAAANIGTANAYAGAANQAANSYGNYQIMSQLTQQRGTPSAGGSYYNFSNIA